MISFRFLNTVLLAGILGGATFASLATGAVDGTQMVAGPNAPADDIVARTADLEMRFVQEDGPDGGHVRVVLTPETRALTIWEARSAAQQAFLEALGEPALGDTLTRITVVVRLMPESYVDPGGAEQIFRFQRKSGNDWSVLAPE